MGNLQDLGMLSSPASSQDANSSPASSQGDAKESKLQELHQVLSCLIFSLAFCLVCHLYLASLAEESQSPCQGVQAPAATSC